MRPTTLSQDLENITRAIQVAVRWLDLPEADAALLRGRDPVARMLDDQATRLRQIAGEIAAQGRPA